MVATWAAAYTFSLTLAALRDVCDCAMPGAAKVSIGTVALVAIVRNWPNFGVSILLHIGKGSFLAAENDLFDQSALLTGQSV